jgi:hypothetical protein
MEGTDGEERKKECDARRCLGEKFQRTRAQCWEGDIDSERVLAGIGGDQGVI